MDGSHAVTVLPSQAAPSFTGRYFRMFQEPDADSVALPDEALKALAAKMVVGPAPVEDDVEDSSVPAGYTYFAQFVAHDLTSDPSSGQRARTDPRLLLNYRTPRFDLDGVYGRGPEDQPYLFRDGKSFLLGGSFGDSVAKDLPRTAQRVALIGDPRNDQNAILSQLHGLFLRLHNKLVAENGSFAQTQSVVLHHYQYVVLNDLLPRLVGSKLLGEFLAVSKDRYRLKGLSSYVRAVTDPEIAIEFSAAACRFGHSMVRPSYRLNRTLSFGTISTDPFGSLVGFAKPMAPSWGIDWDLFVDPANTPERKLPRDSLQMAYKIDACLSEPLTELPSVIVSLAERNLVRGRSLSLPSGQAVARELEFDPLPDKMIRIGDVSRGNDVPISDVHAALAGNCPLWTYVLAEASEARARDAEVAAEPGAHPRQLGDVGGHIVAETFLALLAADPTSILNVPFKPSLGDPSKPFDLAALIAAALA
jgi:hypothetical protein